MNEIYITDLNNSEQINKDIKRNVTIGFFDALHLGHQRVIKRLQEQTDNDLVVTIITFDNHPFKKLITPIDEKISYLNEFEIDEVIIIKMSETIKNSTADQFIQFLKDINTNTIYIGKDFKFGSMQKGDVKLLQSYFNVEVVNFKTNNEIKISSSIIREYLENYNINKIKPLIGRNYSITGEVVHGDEIGRTINFPTANIITQNFVPAFGVYKTKTTINNKIYDSITNIGRRPTINANNTTIETYIIDFNKQIYGDIITIEFIDFLRKEQKFNSLKDLSDQIEKDKQKVIDSLKK